MKQQNAIMISINRLPKKEFLSIVLLGWLIISRLTFFHPKRMPTKLKLEWPEHEFSREYNALMFNDESPVKKDGPFFAELIPPLKIGNESLSHVYLTDFTFSGSFIIIFTPDSNVIFLPENLEVLTIKIVPPRKFLYFDAMISNIFL